MIGLVLFFISTLGFGLFFHNKIRFTWELSWISSFITQTLMIFLGSLLHLLVSTMHFIYILGIFLFAYYFVKKTIFLRKENRHQLNISWSTIIVVIIAIIFGRIILSSVLTHYDNFSHWALIVKYLFFEQHLPDSLDTLITFTSYPPGTAIFTNYVLQFVGFSDSKMLLGQFILILSIIYALFSPLKFQKSKYIGGTIILVFIGAIAIFDVGNVFYINMLVDFIIPLNALATIAGMYSLNNELKKLTIYTSLQLIFMSIIKSSALLFSAIIVIYFIYLVIGSHLIVQSNHKIFFKKCLYICIVMCSSIIFLLIWNSHVDHTFESVAKHQVNIESYVNNFLSLDRESIVRITKLFLTRVFKFSEKNTVGIFILASTVIILGFLFVKHTKLENRRIKTYFIVNMYNFLILGIYIISLYFMYIFSMPLEEALMLAGFNRYMMTIIIFNYGIFTLSLIYIFEEIEIHANTNQSFKFTMFFSSLLFILGVVLNLGKSYQLDSVHDKITYDLNKVTNHSIPINSDKFLIISNSKERGFINVAGNYYLFSDHVKSRDTFMLDNSEFQELINDFDYLVVISNISDFNHLMKVNYDIIVNEGIIDVNELNSIGYIE